MVENILKCRKYEHQDDVSLFCFKHDCKYETKFLCITCTSEDELDHVKDHKDYLININNLMKNDNKPLKNFVPNNI